jgi:hypothetical protein
LYSENLPLQINIQKMDSIFRNKLKLIDLWTKMFQIN